MPLTFVRNDIINVRADAVVNAANRDLKAGGGVCGAIFEAAGAELLQAACDRLAPCETGQAVLTTAFGLPNAKFILHAVGPRWQDGRHGEEALLYACYQSALRLAQAHRFSSVAFPLISAGTYGYPPAQALKVAVRSIRDFLDRQEDLQVTLALYDRAAFDAGTALHREITAYIEDHQVRPDKRRKQDPDDTIDLSPLPAAPFESQYAAAAPLFTDGVTMPVDASFSDGAAGPWEPAHTLFSDRVAAPAPSQAQDIRRLLSELDAPFSTRLFRLIDERGLKDSEVYHRANLDRRHFAKLRHADYRPGKNTVLALCVALRLNRSETNELLGAAGFALSGALKSDLIVAWFIDQGQYDIDLINETLFDFDQQLLGAS